MFRSVAYKKRHPNQLENYIMKITTAIIAAAAVLLPLTAQADHHGKKPTKNVVEIAAGAKDFSTLVAAVKAG
ncbi:hypothetical protein N8593_01230, partial [bacterium]|nr:hypothetical protein [bacterium]